MGFKRVRPLVTSKYIILYSDSAIDWEASAEKYMQAAPEAQIPDPASDAPAAAPETTEEMRARVKLGVEAMMRAWRDDPCDPKVFVMHEGKSPARFSLQPLSGDDLMMVNDAARAMTQQGQGFLARYEMNRKTYLARAACIEARQVFPGDEIHSFSVSPSVEGGIGHIDDLWAAMPLDAQRVLGEAINLLMESGTAKQGK